MSNLMTGRWLQKKKNHYYHIFRMCSHFSNSYLQNTLPTPIVGRVFFVIVKRSNRQLILSAGKKLAPRPTISVSFFFFHRCSHFSSFAILLNCHFRNTLSKSDFFFRWCILGRLQNVQNPNKGIGVITAKRVGGLLYIFFSNTIDQTHSASIPIP
jgi:hypothetical protein